MVDFGTVTAWSGDCAAYPLRRRSPARRSTSAGSRLSRAGQAAARGKAKCHQSRSAHVTRSRCTDSRRRQLAWTVQTREGCWRV